MTTRNGTEQSAEAFSRSVLERLSSKPGMVNVGISSLLPASGVYGGSGYTVEGESEATWKLQFAMFSVIYGEYFRAMGIPLREGRYFDAEDRAHSLPVVIVNESMARHRWLAFRLRYNVSGPQDQLSQNANVLEDEKAYAMRWSSVGCCISWHLVTLASS